jgi:hypothetical protein
VTFLRTRTSTGSKVDVFHQSQPLTQSSDVTHAVRVVKNVTCLSSLFTFYCSLWTLKTEISPLSPLWISWWAYRRWLVDYWTAKNLNFVAACVEIFLSINSISTHANMVKLGDTRAWWSLRSASSYPGSLYAYRVRLSIDFGICAPTPCRKLGLWQDV